MNFYASTSNSILDNFLALSSWQAAVSVLIFFALQIGLWFFLKYIRIQFIYRILIGMALGLIFGLVIQGIMHFPKSGLVDQFLPPTDKDIILNPSYRLWAVQLNLWISLMKNIFINGILLLTAPVVFIAIFRAVSKPTVKGVARITAKGLSLLLMNVLFAFVITFWIGYFVKTGKGIDFPKPAGDPSAPEGAKPLPMIIWDYVPSNLITPWLTVAVIPLMVLGAILGRSVRLLSKHHNAEMNKIRHGADIAWNLVISALMTFMKIMPLAVMSMLASALVSKPIGALASIGKLLGVGYLCILLCMVFVTIQVWMAHIKVGQWWKAAFRVLIQGFATQSSNATLPTAINVLEDQMKVDSKVVSILTPLSATMGLMGCAGVQSGLITSFLWTGTNDPSVHSMGLFAYFILALVITLIASLGIAGVPGTAAVVTAGVLGGLGLGVWFGPVYSVIGSLDGLFDMGRTGLNVLAPQAEIPIVAKSEGLILDGSPLLSPSQLAHQKVIAERIEKREKLKAERAQKIKARLAKKAKPLANKKTADDPKKPPDEPN